MFVLLRRIYRILTRIRWNIGIADFENVMSNKKLDIVWIKHKYKDRWFADPFILEVTDEYFIVLVEEYCYKIGRGRIAKLTIEKVTHSLVKNEVVLELPSHLSFPAIYRNGGDIYIYPENSETGMLNLYKYNPVSNETILVSKLCDDPLTDATMFDYNGIHYLWATRFPRQNKNILDIYVASAWGSQYCHIHSILMKENIARNSGCVFQYKGHWFRPTQICNKGYGEGVVIQEVIDKNGKLELIDQFRFTPTSNVYNLGLHTFNVYENIVIVDGKGYRNSIGKFIGNVIKMIQNNI